MSLSRVIGLCLVLIALANLGCLDSTEMRENRYPNGQLKETWGELRAGDGTYVKHGRYEAWYQNGKKAIESTYDKDTLIGAHLEWHKDGTKKTQGTYVKGTPLGRWTQWDEYGEVDGEFELENASGWWKGWVASSISVMKNVYRFDDSARTGTHHRYRKGVLEVSYDFTYEDKTYEDDNASIEDQYYGQAFSGGPISYMINAAWKLDKVKDGE